MVNEKLKKYIEESLKAGISSRDIEKKLLNLGYTQQTVLEHFKIISSQNSKNNNLVPILIFFIILSIFLFGFIVFLYKTQISPDYPIRYDKLVMEAKQLCNDEAYEKGLQKLEKARQLNNLSANAFGIMGFCYIRQNKTVDAIIALTEATRRSSIGAINFYNLGIAYCRIGNYNFGTLNLKRSIELNPTNPDFYRGIIDCYEKAGNKEEAKRHSDTLNKINSINK